MYLRYILILLASFILSACSQSADIYFYSDGSWKVSSRVVLDRTEQAIFNLIDEQLTQFDIPLPVSTVDLAGGLSDRGLEALRAQYASMGIDLRVSGFGSSRSLTATGKTLDQFNQLLPGVVTLSKDAEDRYRLQAEFGEEMIAAAMFYKLEIRLHAGKIYSADVAARERGSTASWSNPPRIDITFSPASPFSFGWILAICGAGLFAVIPFAFITNKRKCSNCGKRVSKHADYCPHCSEPMGGTSSGGNYF